MRKPVVVFLTVIGILLSHGTPSLATSSVIVDRVVAVVNDEIITMSDLQREENLNKKGEVKHDERLVLEDMIDRKLQMAVAKRVGMDVTDKELAEALADIMKRNNLTSKQFSDALAKEGISLDQYRAELREQIALARLFNKYVRSGIAVDEAEVRAFYERNTTAYALPQEIRVRQIFLSLPENATPGQIAAVKEKAEAVYNRAKKGEDFIQLVREVSQGVTVKDDGDLGFMQREQALSEIQEATRALTSGDISSPFLCAGGYNILRMEEIKTPRRAFDKVKDEITKTLYEQKVENTYRSWLQTLRSDSHIENRL